MKIIKSKFYYFLSGIAVTIGVVYILSSLFFTPSNPSAEDFPQGYRIVNPVMPDYLEFAGERIPTENFDVFERMEREFITNTYWHSSTILAIKRAGRWFPVIEPILEENDIPEDFKYLCVAESLLDNVISPVGATGFWQFMKAAGKKYGLEINGQVDERYHLEKSTEAACKYLQDSYNMFGSWIAAAASYNMGQEGLTNQRERQKAKNYFNLVLNYETSRFVGRLVAFKYIMQNPSKFGFDIKDENLYKPLDYYEVTLKNSVDDFADFAATYGINYYTLKMFNPWLRENYLKNSSAKAYKIKLPEIGSIEVIKEKL
ncbi:MAG: lytic transglycosylase domain-containing protein [Ignavibacteria bacterium]|nr:lytic transglycosylase domain-containing protein [Ignavibacteria bacterium]MBT8383892.1 lytic transglycosylase domain-containing protein [Ignavibacteria bacterium]MBT8390641.1 lytic transglycosylase domain-containing protein [Ignavibacteria bacterium]NNJ51708.1 lytic transglycosylase domain-containing protein [Ignavibacteriaceae bacterium]NNL22270.1 lytic transglycosylase domain-containing protein [Ignavibacteriaceae bacterium]